MSTRENIRLIARTPLIYHSRKVGIRLLQIKCMFTPKGVAAKLPRLLVLTYRYYDFYLL